MGLVALVCAFVLLVGDFVAVPAGLIAATPYSAAKRYKADLWHSVPISATMRSALRTTHTARPSRNDGIKNRSFSIGHCTNPPASSSWTSPAIRAVSSCTDCSMRGPPNPRSLSGLVPALLCFGRGPGLSARWQ